MTAVTLAQLPAADPEGRGVPYLRPHSLWSEYGQQDKKRDQPAGKRPQEEAPARPVPALVKRTAVDRDNFGHCRDAVAKAVDGTPPLPVEWLRSEFSCNIVLVPPVRSWKQFVRLNCTYFLVVVYGEKLATDRVMIASGEHGSG